MVSATRDRRMTGTASSTPSRTSADARVRRPEVDPREAPRRTPARSYLESARRYRTPAMSSEPDLPSSWRSPSRSTRSPSWPPRGATSPRHGFPYGDDMSSRVAEVGAIARHLARLDFDFWFPDENLGYPMFLAYQPFPSLLGGLLVALTPLEPATYVKGANAILWSLVPATWFVGGRWLGLSRIAALAFGLLVAHVSDWRDFGLGVESIAYKGLFTQSFGMVLLPLALGSFHRKVVLGAGRRRTS